MAAYLFGMTDAGKVRDNNEDVFIAEEVMNGQYIIAGVIDGVGGYEGGEIAANLTRDIILEELAVVSTDITTQLEIAFNLANEEIISRKLGNQDLTNMACVATVAVLDKKNNLLHYIHVGDTRLYLFRDNSLVKLSHDQSFVGFLEDSGRLTEEAAMIHPKRNQINQALGVASRMGMTDVYFETGSSPFLPGDMILVCSDGLTDLVDKAKITALLNGNVSIQVKAKQLIQEANDAGGKDNITIVLAKNDKAAVVHEKAMPAAKVITDIHLPQDGLYKSSEDILPQVKQEVRSVNKPKNNSLLYLFSFLSLAFLCSSIWLYLDREAVKNGTAMAIDNPSTAVIDTLKPQEKLFNDMLTKIKGDTLLLNDSVFKSPVLLSKAINITTDTLLIKAIGNIVFKRDSAYKGPAIILAPGSKHISIDNVVFEGFDTAIVSYNNALDLKNIRFINCKLPVQASFLFADSSFVNGRISKRAFQTDSIAKK